MAVFNVLKQWQNNLKEKRFTVHYLVKFQLTKTIIGI